MSDPQSSYGEPVDEPTTGDDDVVGRAEEGLADAEAAGRSAVEPADASDPGANDVVEETVVEESVVVDETPSAANEWAAEPPSWAANAPMDDDPVEADAAPTAVYEESVTVSDTAVAPSEPVTERETVAPVAAQPIFVQAPEAPRPRGNRAAAGAIGILAALSFAVLYLGAWLGLGAIEGAVTVENLGTVALEALGTWALWVPTAIYFIAFWLLGAIVNRGRWGAWVIFGLLVGVAAYGGHLLGQLFQAPFWQLTASQGAQLVESQLLAPLAIVALVLGRELTIWFGAWAAARGKRVTELNLAAQHEYERTLEAGPQLARG